MRNFVNHNIECAPPVLTPFVPTQGWITRPDAIEQICVTGDTDKTTLLSGNLRKSHSVNVITSQCIQGQLRVADTWLTPAVDFVIGA